MSNDQQELVTKDMDWTGFGAQMMALRFEEHFREFVLGLDIGVTAAHLRIEGGDSAFTISLERPKEEP